MVQIPTEIAYLPLLIIIFSNVPNAQNNFQNQVKLIWNKHITVYV